MARSVKSKSHRNVGHLKVSTKIRPYGFRGKFKDMAIKTDHVPGSSKGVSRYDKLITKNANRALKKKMRRMLNRECDED